eukprot:3805821-Amphidinium_carterae.1
MAGAACAPDFSRKCTTRACLHLPKELKLAHADKEVELTIPENNNDQFSGNGYGGWLPPAECRLARALDLLGSRKLRCTKVPGEKSKGCKLSFTSCHAFATLLGL